MNFRNEIEYDKNKDKDKVLSLQIDNVAKVVRIEEELKDLENYIVQLKLSLLTQKGRTK